MADLFQVGDRAIEAREIPALLKRYQLMPQFVREVVLDRAIADYSCTAEEQKTAIGQFCQKHQLTSPEAIQEWLKNQNLTQAELTELAVRPVRIEKFKQDKWSKKVKNHFMERKSGLDRVIYSLLRTQDEGLAHELYYRILEGEQTFAECANEYSQGPEARSGGLLGPVPLIQPHPAIGKLLSVSQPGQLWAPRPLAEWFIIVRLEEFRPAQLDESMRKQLIEEMFQGWLKEQIQHVDLTPSALPS
ncbi:MAG: peptidylprolyl isomerase [Cyanobacteriota bacterium]|nr:peptidylprolyl isomerase [Cyanobacteriota bacterium]